MAFIRRVEEKDIEDVGKLYLKAFEHCEESLRFYLGFKDYVKFAMNQGYAYVMVDEVCCGVILAYETPDMFCGKTVYIELLAVLPEYRKRGYAKLLMNQIFNDAQERKIKKISISTACYMESYQIYKNYGFQDTRSDLRYMVKILKSDTEN